MTSRAGAVMAWLKTDFNLNSIPSSAFYHGQWDSGRKDGLPSLLYLIYRFLFTVIFIYCTFYILTCPGKIFYVFFTYWNMFTQTLYATLYFLYIVWRKGPYLALRFRGRAQVRDVEQQVSVPVKDAIPSEIGSAELVSSPTQGNFETVIPTDLKTSSLQSIGIKSDNNNNDEAGVARVTIPSNHHKVSNKNGGGHLTCLEKVICILMAVTQTIPFIVALVYWTKIYKYEDFGTCKTVSNYYITHSATAIFALIDTLVVAIPARLTHFIFPVTFTSIYMLFSYTYEQAGGTYRSKNGEEVKFIYKELNWKETPGSALVFAVLAILGAGVFHTIVRWGVYKIKHKIASPLSKASGD